MASSRTTFLKGRLWLGLMMLRGTYSGFGLRKFLGTWNHSFFCCCSIFASSYSSSFSSSISTVYTSRISSILSNLKTSCFAFASSCAWLIVSAIYSVALFILSLHFYIHSCNMTASSFTSLNFSSICCISRVISFSSTTFSSSPSSYSFATDTASASAISLKTDWMSLSIE